MSNEGERLVRRRTFDEVPETYEQARPPYPSELLRDVVERGGVAPGKTCLELGPGTGQLTVPMARTGASILAVELGPQLAAVLREKVTGYEPVEVVVADFDTWDAGGRTFDQVMAASSFHWFDPATRLVRCHSLLKRGGSIVIVDVRWGVRTPESDDLFPRIQDCYRRGDPSHDPGYWHPTPEEVPTRLEELRESGLFEDVWHRRYQVNRRYSRSDFVSLIRTYSTVGSWESEIRDGFLTCVDGLLERWFPQGVTQTDIYDLSIARAP